MYEYVAGSIPARNYYFLRPRLLASCLRRYVNLNYLFISYLGNDTREIPSVGKHFMETKSPDFENSFLF